MFKYVKIIECEFQIQTTAVKSIVWCCTDMLDANRFIARRKRKQSVEDGGQINDRSPGRLIHQFASPAYFNISDINLTHCEENESAAQRKCDIDKLDQMSLSFFSVITALLL